MNQIVSERLKAERAGQKPITISSADPRTPETAEKRRRFHEEGKARAEKKKAAVEEMMAELSCGGREWIFTTALSRLWVSAQWVQTNQFRNGKPLGQQFGQELTVIYILADGISRWQQKQMQDGGASADEDFAYHTPEAMKDGLVRPPNERIG